jgi:uncharacterized protein (DUF2126 family)
MEGQVLESVNNNPYLGVELPHWQYPHYWRTQGAVLQG